MKMEKGCLYKGKEYRSVPGERREEDVICLGNKTLKEKGETNKEGSEGQLMVEGGTRRKVGWKSWNWEPRMARWSSSRLLASCGGEQGIRGIKKRY